MEKHEVLCPYCGSKMVCTEPHMHTTRCGVGVMLECHFRCPNCQSGAPWVDDKYNSDNECVEAAYQAAITRAN